MFNRGYCRPVKGIQSGHHSSCVTLHFDSRYMLYVDTEYSMSYISLATFYSNIA